MKMISESKLKEIRRSLYDDDGYTRINNPHFDLIFEEAFKAGMNYVNNGVLDDVINDLMNDQGLEYCGGKEMNFCSAGCVTSYFFKRELKERKED